jgi:maleate isomerase
MSTIKPDGSGWRAHIGVLTHADQTISESEFWTMAPEGVSVETARVPFSDYRTYADPPGPDNATKVLASLQLQCIVYAFTAGSYLLGPGGERTLIDRLQESSQDIPVIMPGCSAVAAFKALEAKRIALFHPPWYINDMDSKGVAYFSNQGFTVVDACHFAPEVDVPHPNFGSAVGPDEMYAWIRKRVPSNIDSLFIAGNGWRTIGVISALEEDLGLPVLTASQAGFWCALRLAGIRAEVKGYGQLFTKGWVETGSTANGNQSKRLAAF